MFGFFWVLSPAKFAVCANAKIVPLGLITGAQPHGADWKVAGKVRLPVWSI
jgi:hypothetical protein